MKNVLLACCLALACACSLPARPPALTEVRAARGLGERVAESAAGRSVELEAAVRQSLDYVRTRPPAGRPFAAAGPDCTWADLGATLERLLEILPRLGTEPGLLAKEFTWREVWPRPLMTGYYEPELEATLTPDPAYPVPLYGLPADLRTADLESFHPRWKGQTLTYRVEDGEIRPYFSRAEIDGGGALNATEAPIAWTRDPVDVFFLQVQGSGRLRLPDGSMRHVLYAGKNGLEYVSLGKVMIERGLVPRDEMSMQRIRAYLRGHPEQVRELLDTNPSYVFFRLADDGPFGAMGRTLTPMVSVATDSAFLPLGSILAVETDFPEADGSGRSADFLALAQDRGGAIKGSRLDLFCGAGEQAGFLAGHLQARSRVFLLLKK